MEYFQNGNNEIGSFTCSKCINALHIHIYVFPSNIANKFLLELLHVLHTIKADNLPLFSHVEHDKILSDFLTYLNITFSDKLYLTFFSSLGTPYKFL